MCKELHQNSPYSQLEFNSVKLKQIYDNHKENPAKSFYILITYFEEEPVGLFIGFAGESNFSFRTHACELAFYVKPKHRSLFVSNFNYNAYEYWAKSILSDTEFMTIGAFDPRSEVYYKRKGLDKIEHTFMRKL